MGKREPLNESEIYESTGVVFIFLVPIVRSRVPRVEVS